MPQPALLRTLLRDRGYVITPCPDTATVDRCIRDARPDACFLDLYRARSDAGWLTLSRLRAGTELAVVHRQATLISHVLVHRQDSMRGGAMPRSAGALLLRRLARCIQCPNAGTVRHTCIDAIDDEAIAEHLSGRAAVTREWRLALRSAGHRGSPG